MRPSTASSHPWWEGLPTPQYLAQMEAADPGSGARHLDDWLTTREQQRRTERVEQLTAHRRAWLMMYAGFSAALLLLVGGVWLVFAGHTVAGTVAAVAGAVLNAALMIRYALPDLPVGVISEPVKNRPAQNTQRCT